MCIHASCSFPPLEPSRGPIPKIPVWTQSQSKFLGQFAVFLPSQCWCARFGELTAMNNIVRTSRRARSKKKKTVLGGSVPTIFDWDCRYDASASPLFGMLGWDRVSISRTKQKSVVVFKTLNQQMPPTSKICSLLVFVTFTTISVAPRTSYMHPNQGLTI